MCGLPLRRWAKTPHGAQTMPRSMTYHPQLQQLVYTPLRESAALRVLPPLAEARGVRVNSSSPHSLGSFGARAGSSELQVRRSAANRHADGPLPYPHAHATLNRMVQWGALCTPQMARCHRWRGCHLVGEPGLFAAVKLYPSTTRAASP